ncbi:MAG: PD40 domain-containing protein [Anaerolineales bacterium]|nr:PD40 domain-containing protein [Anaerolineales bacterium]
MENILAAWSPDGEHIAVVRRDLAIPRGDQIWLMRADGNDAHMITDTPSVLHGTLSWSPDGKYILYDLYLLDSFPLQSRLEMIEIKTGEITNLEVFGYNPKWLWQK